eukprot:6211755-Pleurochrysis_carterae.AAC.1
MEIVGDRRLVARTRPWKIRYRRHDWHRRSLEPWRRIAVLAIFASQRRCRAWGRYVGAVCACAREDRVVESRVGVSALVVCHFARGLDIVDQGEVYPDSVDV